MSLTRSRPRVLTLVSLLLAPALALSTLSVAAPAQAQKIKPTFWGMHDNEWTTPPTVTIGSANFTTTGTYWRNVETSKGNYDFTRLDLQVSAAEGVGAQPMVLLGQTPKFHSTKPRSSNVVTTMPKIKAWKKYVTKVAARYGTRIDYQIWPEPNIIQNWSGTPKQMAQLTVVAAKAIQKAAGKKAKVISPAVALRLPSQQDWTVKYFKSSVGGVRPGKVVDAVAIDPFPAQKGTPEDSYKIMQTIKKKLGRIGVHKPFWNNEINYGVAGGGATTTTSYPVPKQQAYVVRTYALSAAAKMARTYWLAWFSSPELAINMTDANGFALPPATSYSVVRSWLNGTNMKGCSKKKNGVWVCTATNGANEVRRIYWLPKGVKTFNTPKSTTRVEDQDGNVDSRTGKFLVGVDYRPIMIASRK
ncbi:hypothetical protein H5V45_14255 [Nocardioides sp. KIGAM211]|uniref:GH10 domain-containing protein n=1 Tax=Nocardioides luti TaxID=2761101 RepID=A0A7X0VCQ9_9ACTN|nr:hypothetical protein [Nocardioides luti]MBB6628483.1 hypothetical protein [Nocardioides luti]